MKNPKKESSEEMSYEEENLGLLVNDLRKILNNEPTTKESENIKMPGKESSKKKHKQNKKEKKKQKKMKAQNNESKWLESPEDALHTLLEESKELTEIGFETKNEKLKADFQKLDKVRKQLTKIYNYISENFNTFDASLHIKMANIQHDVKDTLLNLADRQSKILDKFEDYEDKNFDTDLHRSEIDAALEEYTSESAGEEIQEIINETHQSLMEQASQITAEINELKHKMRTIIEKANLNETMKYGSTCSMPGCTEVHAIQESELSREVAGNVHEFLLDSGHRNEQFMIGVAVNEETKQIIVTVSKFSSSSIVGDLINREGINLSQYLKSQYNNYDVEISHSNDEEVKNFAQDKFDEPTKKTIDKLAKKGAGASSYKCASTKLMVNIAERSSSTNGKWTMTEMSYNIPDYIDGVPTTSCGNREEETIEKKDSKGYSTIQKAREGCKSVIGSFLHFVQNSTLQGLHNDKEIKDREEKYVRDKKAVISNIKHITNTIRDLYGKREKILNKLPKELINSFFQTEQLSKEDKVPIMQTEGFVHDKPVETKKAISLEKILKMSEEEDNQQAILSSINSPCNFASSHIPKEPTKTIEKEGNNTSAKPTAHNSEMKFVQHINDLKKQLSNIEEIMCKHKELFEDEFFRIAAAKANTCFASIDPMKPATLESAKESIATLKKEVDRKINNPNASMFYYS